MSEIIDDLSVSILKYMYVLLYSFRTKSMTYNKQYPMTTPEVVQHNRKTVSSLSNKWRQ